MKFQQLLDSITPDIYENLKRSVELGKWPDGRRLTQEQLEASLQAVISYEVKNQEITERSGYLPPKPIKKGGTSNTVESAAERTLKWTSSASTKTQEQ